MKGDFMQGKFQPSVSAFIGPMLSDAMKHNNIGTQELAERLHFTPSYISKVKRDKARLQVTAVVDYLEALPEQNQFFAIDAANKLVGITTPVIDGDRIMKEPLAMAVKTMPELSEAMAAIQDSLDELTIPKEDLRPEDFEDPTKLVGECFDAVLYLLNLIAYVCRGFNFSMQDELSERMQLWVRKDIIKNRRE
ncbi:helix-turn-helix transcriptional regulator [Lactiplantibacillus daowaiensis]|uniref:Helix-turn-helix transcriptional regulator n=2 Tax=Lactiplantibacillus daowaiensis TaxID=2559918 RepID=A0ABW1RXR8_9LACO|nr:helix-turn-helix transcriptional regulator [Lactiplantibacillus daowaiensis]